MNDFGIPERVRARVAGRVDAMRECAARVALVELRFGAWEAAWAARHHRIPEDFLRHRAALGAFVAACARNGADHAGFMASLGGAPEAFCSSAVAAQLRELAPPPARCG